MNLFLLFFTVASNYIGVSLLFPLIFPLIMEPETGFLAQEISGGIRGLFLGVIIGSTALAKFISFPLFGSWSDKVGRKRALFTSLYFICCGSMVGFAAVVLKNISLLIFSRILDGIGAGNYAVAQASISDSFVDARKTKNFALLNSACGIGYVVGPLIGEFLRIKSLFGLDPFITPFLAAFCLVVCNITLIYFFKETNFLFKHTEIDILKPLLNCIRAFRLTETRSFFLMIFIFCLGWGFFCELLPAFLLKVFLFGSKEIGYFYTYVGIMIAFCQGIAIRPFVNRFKAKNLLLSGFIFLALIMPLLLLIQSPFLFFIALFPIVFFQTLIFPNAARLLSDMTPKHQQGEFLGIYQSLQAMGMAAGPICFGSFVAAHPNLPIIAGTVAPFATLIIIFFFQPFQQKRVAL